MSAFDRGRQRSTAVAQQLGFHVSNAQKPRALHQEGSLTDAVALQATEE